MKKIYKIAICSAMSFCLLFMTAFAVQDNNFTISKQTKIVINDQDIDTFPIIHGGQTYIKARDIAPWLDLKVGYDAKTKTVSLSNVEYQNSLNDTTIMTINGTNVPLGRFNSYAKWLKFYSGLDDISKSDRNSFKEFVSNEIIDSAAVTILAKQNNVELTSDDYGEIDERINNISKKFNTKDDFASYLYNDIGISYINYYCIEEAAHLREKLKDVIVGDISQTKLKNYYTEHTNSFKKNNAYVQHILFKTTDGNGNIMPYNKKKEVENKALMVLSDIKSGKIDFDDAAEKYTEDESYNTYPKGFTAQEGSVQNEFWNAVCDVKEGSITPTLVETKYGYHIIKVMSKSDVLPFDEVKEVIIEVMRNNTLNDEIKKVESSMNISYNKNIYDSYTIY